MKAVWPRNRPLTDVTMFISYKRRDLDDVRPLAQELEANFGDKRVFFDLADIRGGERWESVLRTQVLASDTVIAAITENWLSDLQAREPSADYVVLELSLALDHGIPILPILFPRVPCPSQEELPSRIRKLLSHNVVSLDSQDLEDGFQEVIGSITGMEVSSDRDGRKRKLALASALAVWFETAQEDEHVLAKAAGTKSSDSAVVISNRRILVVGSGESPLEFQPQDLMAVRFERSTAWLLTLEDEIELAHLGNGEPEQLARAIQELRPALDSSEEAPSALLRRAQRIMRARKHFNIKDDVFTTGGDRPHDSVVFVCPDRTLLVRRKNDQEGVLELAHDELGAICRHRRSVWFVNQNGEHRLDHVPDTDLDQLISILAKKAPRAHRYEKPPDRQVSESLFMLDPQGLAHKSGIDLSWTKEMRPTPEEAIFLAVAKLQIMSGDLRADPDWQDRITKRKTIDSYVRALLGAFAAEVPDAEGAARSLKSLRSCTANEEWADEFRQTLSPLEPEDALRVLEDNELFESMCRSVTRKDRGLILLVELASFYPWDPKIKFEKDSRQVISRQIAKSFTASVGAEDFDKIDQQLKLRAKKFANKGLDWKKLIPLILGGTALGVLTGGMAAPLIGSAIGSAMGLSGAAATSAGLALLGGGSLAAGGAGMAGGAALVGAIGGVSGAGVGFMGNKALDRGGLLTESVKLDLLIELVLLKERQEAQQVASVIALLDQQIADLRDESDVELPQSSEPVPSERAGAKFLGVFSKTDEKARERKDHLTILDGLRESSVAHLEAFAKDTRAWIEQSETAFEVVKQTLDPSLLVVIDALESASDLGDRVAGVIPALLARRDGTPLASIVVDVMTGETRVTGEDALRVRGVKSEAIAELGGATIDVACHPLVWGIVASATLGLRATPGAADPFKGVRDSILVLPAGAAAHWLAQNGIKFPKLAKAIVSLVDREIRQVVGEAAIDIGEGLTVALTGPRRPVKSSVGAHSP